MGEAVSHVLNKGEMVDRLMAENGKDFTSRAAAGRAVSAVFDMVRAELASGGSVRIQDFGTFETYRSEARPGRNPGTGEPMEIPASNRVRFRAASAFKDAVNEG